MARVNLMKNIVTSRRQPHTPLDNVNTPYNPIRWACYRDDHWKVSYFVSQTAEGGASRPGGGQPLHQRALHREDRQPQARHQVSQAPRHGRGEPPHWPTILQSTLLSLKYSKHLPLFITGLWGWVRLSPQAFWARCRGQVLSSFFHSHFWGQLACSWLLLYLIIFQRLPVPQPAASEGLRQPDQTCLRTSSCQKINALAILLNNLMRAALRMTTLLICNLATIIQLKDDGHEDSADLLCDRLPIVLLARYRLHNQLCNFKHLCSASKLYKSYSIE